MNKSFADYATGTAFSIQLSKHQCNFLLRCEHLKKSATSNHLDMSLLTVGGLRPLSARGLVFWHRNDKGEPQHGFSKTREYHIWHGILQRCFVPTNCNYSKYGGRGITVSDDWMSFENFFRDMGPRPSPKHSVERKNNSLGYSAENCVWATIAEQHNNTRANVRLAVNGESKTLAQWSRATGISLATLSRRKKCGWTDYDCVMTPVAPSSSKARPVVSPSLGA